MRRRDRVYFFLERTTEKVHINEKRRGDSSFSSDSFSSYPDSSPQGWHDWGHEQDPIEYSSHGFRTYRIAAHFRTYHICVHCHTRFRQIATVTSSHEKKNEARLRRWGTCGVERVRAAWKKNQRSTAAIGLLYTVLAALSASDTERPRRGSKLRPRQSADADTPRVKSNARRALYLTSVVSCWYRSLAVWNAKAKRDVYDLCMRTACM